MNSGEKADGVVSVQAGSSPSENLLSHDTAVLVIVSLTLIKWVFLADVGSSAGRDLHDLLVFTTTAQT